MRLVIVVSLVACGGSTGMLITPPGVPATCTAVPDLAGCDHDAIGYSCTASRPDAGSAALACSAGFAVGSATEYCCAVVGTTLPACAPVVTVGCADPAIAIACTGSAAPGADSALPCSAGQPGSDATTIFCCTAGELSTQCAADAAVPCGDFDIGYACAGTATPADVDAEVTCTAIGSGGNGTTTYCCASL